jgi:hypothetical protein
MGLPLLCEYMQQRRKPGEERDELPGGLDFKGSGICGWNWVIHFHNRHSPPQIGSRWKQGRFSGQNFALQPDGTLHCPTGQTLVANERRREADGGLRVVYAASIRSCRPCPLRHQCQWEGSATKKLRQVSILLHPLQVGSAPLFWHDWRRREHRRACMRLVRHQRLEVSLPPPHCVSPRKTNVIFSRAQRAHVRLSWTEQLARNAPRSMAGQVTIKLFGIPEDFALLLGLAMV